MELLIQFTILIASLVCLLFFADKLVDAAAKLAKAVGVSGTLIGLTVLAYGTSLPELAVSSFASVQYYDQLSVSNIVGSNIYNIAVIMGVCAIITLMENKDRLLWLRDGSFMTGSAIFLIIVLFFGEIGRIIGFLMVLALVGYTYYIVKHEKETGPMEEDKTISKGKIILTVLVCLAGVLISGNYTVNSAANVARLAGVTEWLIGATIVAAGTSLPETVVSIIAAKKREMGISIGNIVGSNYFNILWILGFASILKPLSASFQPIATDLLFLFIITIWFQFDLMKGKISKIEGVGYVLLYIIYLSYLTKILPV